MNLGLKIVGKDANNYHLLNTVMCMVNLYDELVFNVVNDGTISIPNHQYDWNINDDLVYRAAKLLQEFTGSQYGVEIELNKLIPVGSGLGGGSSNAATTLLCLNYLWNTGVSKEDLHKLGLALGADVPFFLHGKNSFATGIGDVFTDINLPKEYFVLIVPKINIATKTIFHHVKFNEGTLPDYDMYKLSSSYENDLFDVAVDVYPELKKVVQELSEYGKISMTGSGSGIYLVYDNKFYADSVAAEIKSKYNNTFVLQKLQESPLARFIIGE